MALIALQCLVNIGSGFYPCTAGCIILTKKSKQIKTKQNKIIEYQWKGSECRQSSICGRKHRRMSNYYIVSDNDAIDCLENE